MESNSPREHPRRHSNVDSNISLYKLNKNERAKLHHEEELGETLCDTSLTHTLQVEVNKTDFSKEIRAPKDIKNFVETSEVLLDIVEDSLESIIDRMLESMMNGGGETATIEEIKSGIFADPSRTRLQEKIQGRITKEGLNVWEQTWLCIPITIPTLNKRYVGIARLKHKANLGDRAEEVRFVILILCPSDVKVTKTALETGRTFATVFSDLNLRYNLLIANTVTEFKTHILVTSTEFANHQARPDITLVNETLSSKDELKWYQFGRGIKADLLGRLPYYLDDFKDGIMGPNTLQKTVATTLFLYFSVILPAVALGVLNGKNTHDAISVKQVIVGQTLGALIFSLLAGQPLVVVMTTAPLALIIKTIYQIAEDNQIDFLAFYACIGLWNSFFVFLYSFFNMSILMKFSTRSTEEIFSNFITIAFIKDSATSMIKLFHPENPSDYQPEVSFLSLIPMMGTLWLGVTLFDFKKTPFLSRRKREILSDYALPVSVVVFGLIGKHQPGFFEHLKLRRKLHDEIQQIK